MYFMFPVHLHYILDKNALGCWNWKQYLLQLKSIIYFLYLFSDKDNSILFFDCVQFGMFI